MKLKFFRVQLTLYSQKLALASPTSGGRSIGIVRSRTQVTEFVMKHYTIKIHEGVEI
jgi:hypothetical protein